MRSAVLSSRELAAAGTWSASELIGGTDLELRCMDCGLQPQHVTKNSVIYGRRPDPAYALLEAVPPPAWRRAKPRYRCRDRAACDQRQERNDAHAAS